MKTWQPLATFIAGQREKRAATREEQARFETWKVEDERRRREFQRETLLSVQDALGQLREATDAYFEAMDGPGADSSAPLHGESAQLGRAILLAAANLQTYEARIENGRLRSLIHITRQGFESVRTAQNHASAWTRYQYSLESTEETVEMLGKELRSLY